jgi:hypothetical protein
MAEFLGEVMGTLGVGVIIIGGLTIAFGYMQGFDTDGGWNSRHVQGITMVIVGAGLVGLKLAAASGGGGVLQSAAFPKIGEPIAAASSALCIFGAAQVLINLINDDFASRANGVRWLCAGVMTAAIPAIVDLLYYSIVPA